jgi:hypothetical protein
MSDIRRFRYWGLLSLLVVILGAAPQSPQFSQPTSGSAPSMEVPLRLIAEARQSYRAITDYTCLFIKREQIRGQLQAENLISMKVRTQPFSVYLYWHKPNELTGQEACYVAGRNNGNMRAHSTGILRTVGFVSVDPADPRCLENSRHAITEAGIGNLIERFGKRWEMENQLGKTVVRVAEYDYDKRRCMRVEMIHPDNSGKEFSFYRTVVYFDKQNHLPIRLENYDWPRTAGDPSGALAESYSYAGLRLNVGLPPGTFEH